MSCGPAQATFRLLDSYVGWDPSGAADSTKNLTGLDQPSGVRLVELHPDSVSAAGVTPYIPPRRLARGCHAREWYLLTPGPLPSRLLKRGPCVMDWLNVWRHEIHDALMDAVAIAVHGTRIAISDAGAGAVTVWARGGYQRAAQIRIHNPGALAFTPVRELLVSAHKAGSRWAIYRYGPEGTLRHVFRDLPDGQVDRIAVSQDCTIWLATSHSDGLMKLWRAPLATGEFRAATLKELAAAFSQTAVKSATEDGFCLEECGSGTVPVVNCFSWYGRPIPPEEVGSGPVPPLADAGQLYTGPIDSGIVSCLWHRVRIDAGVPVRTALEVSIASSTLPEEMPHPSDWQDAPAGSQDFLLTRPPGRYLFLRVRFTGDGVSTPVLRRIRIDFPRSTSLELLPAVYRDNPQAEDFTERFLSLFDASIEDLDRVIERFPALMDVDSAPAEALPWLGSFLGVVLDSTWEPERRRAILKNLPVLYRKRGTVEGLLRAIQLIFDLTPSIQELPGERAWAAVSHGRLRALRLFGKTRSRFLVGRSALGSAPLRSYGDPQNDAFATHAYRFRVQIPPAPVRSKGFEERLQRLIESQKPAHATAVVRVGGTGFIVGTWSSVGVDTVFAPVAPPVLGTAGNIRLRRMSVLWPGHRAPRSGIVPGETAAVGIQTLME